jgi:DHA1 family multidrug resistance protein-like MFS transporter
MGALAEKLRKLPGNVRGVLGYTFFSGLAGNMYRPLVVPFFRGLGLDSAVVGAFMALQSGFSSAASVTGGFLGDWLGRRRLIMAAKLMAIVYLPVLILMRSPSAAAVVFVLMGLEAIGSAPFTAIMADCTDESNRGTFMGIIQTISWTMQMLVPLLGGVLADTLGPKAAFGVSLPLVLASMVSLRVVASSRKASETASVGRQAKQVAQGIWRPGWRRSVAGIAGMEFFNGISNGVINLVLPYYLMDRFGAGFTGVSAIGVSVAVGTVLVVGGGKVG